jgi:hypothetical protein
MAAPKKDNRAKKENLRRVLALGRSGPSRIQQATAEEEAKWDKEIAALESRVHTEEIDVDLGNGTSITVRTCLSAEESLRISDLEDARLTETSAGRKAELAAEMIEIITPNRLITKEWLMENRDKYALSDILTLLMGYTEVRLKERADHLRRLQSAAMFRPVQSGAELRAVPPLPPGDRPT